MRECIEGCIAGKDARQIVILKGDFENQKEKGGLVKEDIARKYITYFQSILHHNNGYFGLVNQSKVQLNHIQIILHFSS